MGKTGTNAVVYARYSTGSRQSDKSIEDQFTEARKYAELRGYTIVHEYADRGVSGRTDNREEFQQMLTDCSNGTFSVIICWKVDRFGRNREEITFNKYRVKKHGVRVEYVAETIPDGPESVILESVLEGMAEYYSLQLSTNIKRGMRENAKQGKYTGGQMPLGYTHDSDMRYIPDPKTVPIVVEAFKRYAGGETMPELIADFNARGLTTVKGKPFTKNSPRTVLKNEKYIGVLNYRGGEIRVENAIPPLIDKETFDRVQEMIRHNDRAPSNRWTRADYILSGKLYCGCCGQLMTGVAGTSHMQYKYNYYVCAGRQKNSGCRKKNVRADWIEPVVIKYVDALIKNDELMNALVDDAWNLYSESSEEKEKRRVLEEQLHGVEKSLGNIMKAIEAGVFNDTLQDRMDELEDQKAALQNSIAVFDYENKRMFNRDQFYQFFDDLRNQDITYEEGQKHLIHVFINAIYLFDDRLEIWFNCTKDNHVVIQLSDIPTDDPDFDDGFGCCASSSTTLRRHF